MGIIANALAISSGGILGSLFKKKIQFKNMDILGIGVMIVSIIGFFENCLVISDTGIKGEHTVLIVLSLIVGTLMGDLLHLEDRIGNITNSQERSLNGVTDATLFFGIGGLQICGSILLGVTGDSSQLYLKSLIDFPFSLMFGASYGKASAFASIPVALMQLLISIAAFFVGSFLSNDFVEQLCAIGYVILFFSGLNLIRGPEHKVSNINMLPAILIIILYHMTLRILR